MALLLVIGLCGSRSHDQDREAAMSPISVATYAILALALIVAVSSGHLLLVLAVASATFGAMVLWPPAPIHSERHALDKGGRQ